MFFNYLPIIKFQAVSAILFGTLLFSFIIPIHAQIDFDCVMGSNISDEEIDGIISSEWNDASFYPNLSIEPTGTADIWTKHDGAFLYIAIKFTADSSNPWVGIQFGQTRHMSSGADGAIFGNDRIGPTEYRDISFVGFGSITSDPQQDGVGVINIGSSNLVIIELKKPLRSGDSAGSDIDWKVDNSYILIILWDSNGGGSSGGNSGHTGSSQVNRTIYINPNMIPEFSGLTFVVGSAIIALLVLISRNRLGKNRI